MTSTPSYDLERLKKLLANEETRIICKDDLAEARKLGYLDEDEIAARVIKVSASEFYKTMPAIKRPGLMQDVYRSPEGATMIYIKLQLSISGKAVVVSFKEK